MSEPTRQEALATLSQGNAALGALFGQLSPDQLVMPATIGGGDWSAKDLLGHIAFWEELAAQTLTEWRAGQRPRIENSFGQQATDAANARNQERPARQSLEQTTARAESAHRAIVEAIQSLSDAEWRAAPHYGDTQTTSLGELLGGVLSTPNQPFGHAFAHLADLEAYVNSVR